MLDDQCLVLQVLDKVSTTYISLRLHLNSICVHLNIIQNLLRIQPGGVLLNIRGSPLLPLGSSLLLLGSPPLLLGCPQNLRILSMGLDPTRQPIILHKAVSEDETPPHLGNMLQQRH